MSQIQPRLGLQLPAPSLAPAPFQQFGGPSLSGIEQPPPITPPTFPGGGGGGGGGGGFRPPEPRDWPWPWYDPDNPGTIFPTLAEGGNLFGGQPAIVGERGPELFVPQQPGTVLPLSGRSGINRGQPGLPWPFPFPKPQPFFPHFPGGFFGGALPFNDREISALMSRGAF